MSNFKEFSLIDNRAEEKFGEVKPIEHTEIKNPNKPPLNQPQQPSTDQTDKGLQPDHNIPKPS